MSDKDVDKIEPVDFDLNDSPLFSNQTAQAKPNKPSAGIWIGLAGLLVVALLVIFVLPTIVSEYELPLERRVDVAEIQPANSATSPASTISPFQEAQRSLQRKEAQDVLAELLLIQTELDLLEVEKWGQVAYEESLEAASIGDEYYRAQDFALARDSYAQGRDGLAILVESIPNVSNQTLINAQKAVEQGDSATAVEQFELATLLDPENEAASIGLDRAINLDEVSRLIASADELAEDGELEQAREIYRQALGLDSYNEVARQQIAEMSAQIIEREFSRIMSIGYAALEQGNPDQAIAEFQRASTLGINQEQALAAITQTENEIANAEINQLQALITTAEGAEQWQAAVDEYDKVLAIDSSLLFAINGRDYAAKRAQLDRLLVDHINNPQRFAANDVFEQARDVYFTGRAIEEPGNVLTTQLDELQVLLENSQVPIDIQLVSDNLTDVTLLRVGGLGLFEQRSLSLKPGRYVAVGKRRGYREVRQEFTVGFGQTPESVVVQCEERIVATNR